MAIKKQDLARFITTKIIIKRLIAFIKICSNIYQNFIAIYIH